MIDRTVRRHQLHGAKRDVAFYGTEKKRDEERRSGRTRTCGKTAVAQEELWSGWN